MPGHHEPVPKDKYLKRLVFGMEGEAPTILPFNPDTLSRACSGMQCGTIPGVRHDECRKREGEREGEVVGVGWQGKARKECTWVGQGLDGLSYLSSSMHL